jgi:UDP-N-acetylglucosamine/UDP-N-acetylgalactosamine diphosphorylase
MEKPQLPGASVDRAGVPEKEALLAHLAPIGQTHLLAFWDELDMAGRMRLAEQVLAIDPSLFLKLREDYRRHHAQSPSVAGWAARAEPPPAMRRDGSGVAFTPDEARRAGGALLRAGKVAMILVAGGLGTRLGFDQPKGMFPLGPLSGRSLFQMLIEQLLAVGRRYGVAIPLYVMTSPATDRVTAAFLESHDWFGLARAERRLFCQGTMWAVDAPFERILLEERDALFLGPDGHGGMLAALVASGLLDEARQRGIEHFFYGQIDNPLLQVCDELLLGSHVLAGSEMTTQVVPKRDALERVGNVVAIDGKVRVIEYSELPEAVARQRNPDGSLRLWAGNLAVHVLDAAFLARCAAEPEALPFHYALKKVAYLDVSGRRVEPRQPNAIRFERFIFDLLPLARRALVVEADPAEAFAPVKNSDQEPTDNPRTARAALMALHRRWLRESGVRVSDEVPVEINPLWASTPAEIAARLPRGTLVQRPTYFSPQGPRPVERPGGQEPFTKPSSG